VDLNIYVLFYWCAENVKIQRKGKNYENETLARRDAACFVQSHQGSGETTGPFHGGARQDGLDSRRRYCRSVNGMTQPASKWLEVARKLKQIAIAEGLMSSG